MLLTLSNPVLAYQIDDEESTKAVLSKRERIYSAIVVLWATDMSASSLDGLSDRIEKEVSVIYGRSRRPVLLVGSRGPSGLLSVRETGSDGCCHTHDEISAEHFFTIIRNSLVDTVQPSEYLLTRNVMEEPTWLVDVVGNCFEHPDLTAVFPAPSPARQEELFRLCESRSFHSPSLTDAECLLSVMYIFDSLNLFSELDVDRGINRSSLWAYLTFSA